MDADNPFDPSATSDIVLRSSDDVHFHVLEAFLGYASPVFHDLLSFKHTISMGENEMRNGLPVVPLTEDSETLRYLLDALYPFNDEPSHADSRVFIKAVVATEKYAMDKVTDKLRKRLHYQTWWKKEPLRTFSVAISVGWRKEATMVARTLLSRPFSSFRYCGELEEISGVDFCRLLEFRHRCERLGGPDSQGAEIKSGRVNRQSTISTSGTDSTQDAAKPFDSPDRADVIVRSSDSIDFYVSQPLLRLVSPVFDAMFTKSEAEESGNGLKIFHVGVNSKALRYIFLMLYHRIDEPPIKNLGLFALICLAAQRFKVPAVEARLKKALMASTLVAEQPLRVYAIAMTLGWIDAAKTAALNAFSKSLEEAMMDVPELELISGRDVYRLVDFRIHCAAVCAMVESRHLRRVSEDLMFMYGGDSAFDSSGEENLGGNCCHMLRALVPRNVKLQRSCPRGSTYADVLTSQIRELEQTRLEFRLGPTFGRILESKDHLVAEIEKAVSLV